MTNTTFIETSAHKRFVEFARTVSVRPRRSAGSAEVSIVSMKG